MEATAFSPLWQVERGRGATGVDLGGGGETKAAFSPEAASPAAPPKAFRSQWGLQVAGSFEGRAALGRDCVVAFLPMLCMILTSSCLSRLLVLVTGGVMTLLAQASLHQEQIPG